MLKWRMVILSVKKKKKDMTVLSTGWHLLCTPHTFGAHKKNEPFTAAHFLTIKVLQRKKQKAQTLESYPHEYLPAFFFSPFILLLTACLILIKPILHSRLFDVHWMGCRYLQWPWAANEKACVIKQSEQKIIQVEEGKAAFSLKVKG